MTKTYLPQKHASYSELAAYCNARGIYPHDELQRYARAYGDVEATDLWYEMIAETLLLNAHDTHGKEQDAWKDMLTVLQRYSGATIGSRLYWLQQHAQYSYNRVRSNAKREVYLWCIATCKPIYLRHVGLCMHCGYDKVYGTGLCVNCGKKFSCD